MSILGINNRTENWKTAALFGPLLGERRVRLAHLLGEDWQTEPHEVRIELFWKGMRDYIYQQGTKSKPDPSKCADAYTSIFSPLRGEIENFSAPEPRNRLLLPNSWNYDVSQPDKLYTNLENTEIDIALETPNHLYIGEAKQESNLGADGSLALVHQLIRQYVMANILLKLMGISKKVVPFLVVDKDKRDGVLKTGQVTFMTDLKKWLKKENVLTWDDVRNLHP